MMANDYEPQRAGVVTTFETRGESNEKVDKKRDIHKYLKFQKRKAVLQLKKQLLRCVNEDGYLQVKETLQVLD